MGFVHLSLSDFSDADERKHRDAHRNAKSPRRLDQVISGDVAGSGETDWQLHIGNLPMRIREKDVLTAVKGYGNGLSWWWRLVCLCLV